MSKKVETPIYLTDEVVTALKIKAVKEKRKYSDVADELLRQRLELKVEPAVKKKRGVALPVIVLMVAAVVFYSPYTATINHYSFPKPF